MEKIKQRYEIIKTAEKIGIIKASVLYNVSRQTIFRWFKRYEKNGIDGLKNRSRKTQSHPSKMPESLVKEIENLLSRNPKISAIEVKEKLKTNYSLRAIQKKISSLKDSSETVLDIKSFYIYIKKDKNQKHSKYLLIAYNKNEETYFACVSNEVTTNHIQIFVDLVLFLNNSNKNIATVNITYKRLFSNLDRFKIYSKSMNDKYNSSINYTQKSSKIEKMFSPPFDVECKSLNDTLVHISKYTHDLNYEINRKYRINDDYRADFYTSINIDHLFKDYDIILDSNDYWDRKKFSNSITKQKYLTENFLKGIESKKNCDFDTADYYLSKVIFYLKDENDNSKLLIKSLIEFSRIKLYKGDRKLSENLLNQALKIATNIDLKNYQYMIKLILLKSMLQQGISTELLPVMNENYENYKFESKSEMGYLFLDLGLINNFLGKTLDAEKLYNKAYRISLNTNDIYLFFVICKAMVNFYFNTGKHKKSTEFLNRIENIAFKFNFPDLLAIIYYSKARMCLLYEDIPNASSFSLKAIEEVQKSNQIALQILVYHQSGYIKGLLNNINEAVSDLMHCINLSKASFNDYLLAGSYGALAEIYRITNDLSKAIHYFEQAIRIEKSINDTSYLIVHYNELASIYIQNGDFRTAFSIIKKENDIAKKINNFFGQIVVFRQKAQVYFLKGDEKKALNLMKKGLVLCEKHNILFSLFHIYRDLAYYYYEKGKIDKIFGYAEKEIEIAKKMKNNYFICLANFDTCKFKLKFVQGFKHEKSIEKCKKLALIADNKILIKEVIDFEKTIKQNQ
ncbi:MAG: helix-turn-helix domain-containing protein [Candidatus Delongbacteria bacterium]|nr:helix-turn-helix domain-containing protein [Candidatus Delongbacteria bacterium]MBN2834807.1 helix-turn-helix domain-containing protein [Candidatus Delongbacteria bacterium]